MLDRVFPNLLMNQHMDEKECEAGCVANILEEC